MHLMPEFGYTVEEIERDGFPVYKKIDISYREDTGRAMVYSLGQALKAFADTFSKLKPDLMLIIGDRGEMLIAAIAANYLNIPVAHLHGGEISGHVDGILRHAITKLAHIHLSPTRKARERVISMGEEPWRVFYVGAPALDRIIKEKLPDRKILEEKYGLNGWERFAILVQHPVITEAHDAVKQIKISLEAINLLKLPTIIIYPNADAGGRKMISTIKKYEGLPFIKTYKSLPHKDYLGLLKAAAVLVGNSSSGVIEASSFKLPVVNIGSRQEGRERSPNIIDVGYNQVAISKAINKAMYDSKFRQNLRNCRSPYGAGNASKKILAILTKLPAGSKLLQKRMTY
jgi:UDP-hydrolysing UDP-N-acetyl-D-glucosamine 2-epimerase